MKKSLLVLIALLLTKCAVAPHAAGPASTAGPGEKLNAAVAEYTEASKRLDAFDAAYFNVDEDLGKFGDDLSPEIYERDQKNIHAALDKLQEIKLSELSTKDQRTYRLFKGDMEKNLGRYAFPFQLLEFNQMHNRFRSFIDQTNKSLTDYPFDSVKHYEDFLRRSAGFSAYVDRLIATLRRGVKEKITLSCVIAGKTLNSYSEGLEGDPEKNPFYRPITFMPATFSAADRSKLTASYREMVTKNIVPHFKRFDRFFREEYQPHCRKEFGIGALPNGKAWYAYRIKASTDLEFDAKAIHEIGLKEVQRIESEIDEVRHQLGYKQSRKAFLKAITHDPKSFFKSSAEMFAAFAKTKAEVSAKIPQYFKLTPKGDYSIVESGNPEDAAGSYHSPTENNSIGRFVINTKNLRAVPVFEVNTLSMHESIPGHHFQLALQFELKDQLSEYQRKIFHSGAFIEGWALYAEYLGREMGMYTDPLQRLGTLDDEMLRAVRLVVDTGIHSLGWTHDQTVRYMEAHLASDTKAIEIEANRYSVWPGQALAYKMGQLKIIELRKLAEKELGPKFDLREFHRVVIGSGTVSLPVLEEQVRTWIHGVLGS